MKTTLISLCSALTLMAPLTGATRTWQGGGGDSLWSNGGNWMGGAPVAGDMVIFPATAVDFSPDLDIANLALTGMAADGGNGFYNFISSSNTTLSLASGMTLDTTPNAGFQNAQIFALNIDLLGPNPIIIRNNAPATTPISFNIFASPISGAAGMTLIGSLGAEFVTLQASNTFMGNVSIDNAAGLEVSSDSSLGNAANALMINGGNLGVSASFTTQHSIQASSGATFSISGGVNFTHDNTNNLFDNTAGQVAKSNTGTMTLTGPQTNSYAAGWFVSQGTLAGTTRTINCNIGSNNNTSVVFLQGFNGNYTNTISGGCAVTKSLSGILNFTNVNSYTGGTTVAASTLALVGAGQLYNMGSVSLTDTSSIFDISAITAGSTTIGPLSGVASSQALLGSKNLITTVPGTTTFAGNILDSGLSGALTKSGLGTYILSGMNNYLGGTTVTGGTLQGDTNSLVGNINLSASTNLNFNQAFNGTYAGQITGSGAVNISGGALNFTGTSNYTGATTVTAGTLAVNGQVTTSSMMIASGATLKGTGTIIGPTSVSGTLMPGNSIGTMNIVGDVVFGNGSTFIVELNPTQSSLLNITGNLTILPDTLQIFPFSGNYPPNAVYTIVRTTGTITGTFTNVLDASPMVQFIVEYFPNHIDLAMKLLNFGQVITKGNPGKAATSLNGITPVPGSDLDTVFNQLYTLNLQQLYAAFNQMQPSLTIGLTLAQQNNFNLVTSALRKRTSALHTLRCNPSCTPKDKNKSESKPKQASWWGTKKQEAKPASCKTSNNWNIWADVSRDFYHQHRQTSNFGFHSDTLVGAAGLDYHFPSNTYVGLVGAYTYSDVDWRHSQADGNINSYYGGLYTSWLNDYAYLNLSAIGAYNNYGSSRKIKFGTIDRHAQERHSGLSAEGHLDLGFTFPAHHQFQYGPFGQADYIYIHQKGYHEHDAKSLNLHVSKYNANMLRSELGLQGRYCIAAGSGFFVPSAKVSWVREMRFNGKHLQARFSNDTAIGQKPRPYTVRGIWPDRSLIAPGASLTALFRDETVSVTATYEGEFGHKMNDNAANITLMVAF
jgi:fibronectin-binding autotransporter adhesin